MRMLGRFLGANVFKLCSTPAAAIQAHLNKSVDILRCTRCNNHYEAASSTDVWSYVANSSIEVDPMVDELFTGISEGRRAALAKGITLVESINPKKKALGMLVLSLISLNINHVIYIV